MSKTIEQVFDTKKTALGAFLRSVTIALLLCRMAEAILLFLAVYNYFWSDPPYFASMKLLSVVAIWCFGRLCARGAIALEEMAEWIIRVESQQHE